jgi:hypothetical protein
MDDGGNYDADNYDTLHNDYAYIPYWAVCIISAARTSVGDLVPPTYDYWTGRYDGDEVSLSQFHITVIWIVFIIQILMFIVFFLNYLIAIVSDSYANIVENESLAVINGRDDLNGDHLRREFIVSF